MVVLGLALGALSLEAQDSAAAVKVIGFYTGKSDQAHIDYEHKTNKELSFTFENETQNRLVLNSLLWLGASKQ
jgi:hypothetical protein